MKKVRRTAKPDRDERPSLERPRLAAEAKRAQKAHAYDQQLIGKLLKQVGVTREELEQRADADFAEAQSESAQQLTLQRERQSASRKTRGPLRERIETAFARLGRAEVIA